MEAKGELVDHILDLLFRGFEAIEGPVQRCLAHWLRLLVVKPLEVWMRQTLFHRVSLKRVECEQLAQQVQRHRVRLWV